MNTYEKYLKYKNKYLKLKKQIGGLDTLSENSYREPLFYKHDLFKRNKLLKKNIIDDISTVNPPSENDYLPVFLISTLFLSYNDYKEQNYHNKYNEFIKKIQAYEHIYLIDYENLINIVNEAYPNISLDYHRLLITIILVEKCLKIKNNLIILCCKHHSTTDKSDIQNLLNDISLNNQLPPNLIVITTFRINEQLYDQGADDDFMFWLLALSLFNIQKDVSNMNKIFLITNDIQKMSDSRDNRVKNLYTEITKKYEFKDAYVNNLNISSFVSLLNMITNYMTINIPNMDMLTKPNVSIKNKKCKNKSIDDKSRTEYDTYTKYLINNAKFHASIDAIGITAAATCNSNRRDYINDYKDTSFDTFHTNVQQNCSNLFIQLNSYIRYIQNIKYKDCHNNSTLLKCNMTAFEMQNFIFDATTFNWDEIMLKYGQLFDGTSTYDPTAPAYVPSNTYDPRAPVYVPSNNLLIHAQQPSNRLNIDDLSEFPSLGNPPKKNLFSTAQPIPSTKSQISDSSINPQPNSLAHPAISRPNPYLQKQTDPTKIREIFIKQDPK